MFAVLNRIISEDSPPPMPAAEDMPPGLHELLLSTFDRDTARRPSTSQLLNASWVANHYADTEEGVTRTREP